MASLSDTTLPFPLKNANISVQVYSRYSCEIYGHNYSNSRKEGNCLKAALYLNARMFWVSSFQKRLNQFLTTQFTQFTQFTPFYHLLQFTIYHLPFTPILPFTPFTFYHLLQFTPFTQFTPFSAAFPVLHCPAPCPASLSFSLTPCPSSTWRSRC